MFALKIALNIFEMSEDSSVRTVRIVTDMYNHITQVIILSIHSTKTTG